MRSWTVWRRGAAGQGLPGVSLNWGPWAEIGAASSGVVAERMRQQGLLGMPPAAGLAALELVLAEAAAGSDTAQLGIASVDWARLLQRCGSGRYLSGLAAPAASATASAPASGQELRTGPLAAARSALRAMVAGAAAAVLGLADAAALAPRVGFFDQGLDSSDLG